ncbi:monovalent cation/H+ antiporter complex subunit F [Nocardioides sp. CFH 31398]|uniref:monovalent cation/H+ antiporter complex subunit F n=1 Tax=Nocardioides sp. CFH 31398 TaxID=2919579 RepID=UPI001F06CFED|nr:monovalent cation/H+ antiporter complex subunit F [Nocardioides sp. CFH 31398]MCH1864946.1 monovalent cation/H+ antiporter complex subunit F [Nocardioides sp. CFH 31398]
MSWLLGASAVVFGVAALLVVVRITRGPTMLDRAIAFDVLVSIAIGGIVVQAAVDGTADAVPLILVATLLGFVGSVSIARFTPGSDVVDDGDESDDTTTAGDRL